jgi:hypothetical protein
MTNITRVCGTHTPVYTGTYIYIYAMAIYIIYIYIHATLSIGFLKELKTGGNTKLNGDLMGIHFSRAG